MQLAMTEVNERNRQTGLPEVQMGIGVHTGEVIAGNIGSLRRAKYSIVGRHVNLTSRIESCTVGGQILASEHTLADVTGDTVLYDGEVKIDPKGVRGTIKVYEVVGLGSTGRKLGARAVPPVPLKTPVRVRCYILEGKQAAGAPIAGAIAALSPSEAVIDVERPFRQLTDLRLVLVGGEGEELGEPLYAKVLPSGGGGQVAVRFTAVSPASAEWIRETLADS
jgi:adenylate cyclase